MSAKHTPGPWVNQGGEILADTREFTCCGNQLIGAVYMGDVESVCCGSPDVEGCAEEVIAMVQYERDIPLVCAASDLLNALTAMVDEQQPLGIDRPVYQAALAAIAKALGETT